MTREYFEKVLILLARAPGLNYFLFAGLILVFAYPYCVTMGMIFRLFFSLSFWLLTKAVWSMIAAQWIFVCLVLLSPFVMVLLPAYAVSSRTVRLIRRLKLTDGWTDFIYHLKTYQRNI
jgi:hypothetical protein